MREFSLTKLGRILGYSHIKYIALVMIKQLNKLSEKLSIHSITKKEFESKESKLVEIFSEAPEVEVHAIIIVSDLISETSSGRSIIVYQLNPNC
ncbi:Putative uncharacterized protein [Lactococcus lactis subsp. lactis A12]|uniref:Uncharacterized protein n=2 Tax=Lactococcus TaxID=1357 RepID=S6EWP9_LACLL|nr:Putative uncharacterized protein [Lactococcus lactis subsp. lactis A12]SBW31836.1 Putative uncharacterized protein [Lactococcus lactis subsp. lactis]SBW31962.1 Putative uncharacterized protein [Lactococcus lactis subsp. lactis]